MSGLLGLLLAIAIVGIFSGFVIWILGKLGLGLKVDNFAVAFITAIIIAVVAGMITFALSILGVQEVGEGLVGGLVHLLVTAVALLIGDKVLPGLHIAGISGALVVAVTIGAVYWLGGLLLGLLL